MHLTGVQCDDGGDRLFIRYLSHSAFHTHLALPSKVSVGWSEPANTYPIDDAYT